MKRILLIDNTFDPPHGSPELRAQLENAAQVTGPVEIVTVRAPDGKVPESADEFDAVVMSGSKTRIAESAPWIDREIALIRKLYDQKIPTLGICYGEQLIVRALGGESLTGAAKTPEFGWVKVEQKEAGARSPLFKGLPKSFYFYQAHSDEVYSLPKNFVLTAASADCPIQAYDLTDAPMWGLQFHPERGLVEGNKALDKRVKENPAAKVINRNLPESEFDPAAASKIFQNFLKLVEKR